MSPRLLIPVLLVAAAAQPPPAGPVRFEEVTEKAGIRFTHSFGAEKLGSLLESTGAGCVWFDYNNDGYPDLYVVSGKPLEKGMHPYPLRKPPTEPPHNHLYRNNGNGTFTDVTEQAESRRGSVQHGRDRGGLRQRRLGGPARQRLRPRHPLPQ